jgi:hypothetical protein
MLTPAIITIVGIDGFAPFYVGKLKNYGRAHAVEEALKTGGMSSGCGRWFCTAILWCCRALAQLCEPRPDLQVLVLEVSAPGAARAAEKPIEVQKS